MLCARSQLVSGLSLLLCYNAEFREVCDPGNSVHTLLYTVNENVTMNSTENNRTANPAHIMRGVKKDTAGREDTRSVFPVL